MTITWTITLSYPPNLLLKPMSYIDMDDISIKKRIHRWIPLTKASLILNSSVGLSAGIQSAGDSVPVTLVRILHSAEDNNLSPFDSKIACLCHSTEINNNKNMYFQNDTGDRIASFNEQKRKRNALADQPWAPSLTWIKFDNSMAK